MKKIGVIIGVLIILSIVGISGCTSSGDANSINVSNLKVSNEGYGTYYVTCDIVPNQDIDYLEMVLVWYDSSDAVIERTSLAWNINDAKEGQTIRAKGMSVLDDQSTPAKVQVLIFDSPFSGGSEEGNIFNTTISV
ncbi:MAG: hypothetical protein A4E25_01887 [Methanobacterium sp. PtaB.Bin024]|jgi:hypothetical protein|nr:MAG: hypothetical protein A4E25_01887 [Methanobacterium sp. PtaB.Bin024]